MAKRNKIDSNDTGLRIAEEASIGVLPGSPVWVQAEPNSYPDFGPEFSLTPRNPINNSRQRKKGVITDLDVNGGYNTDLTQKNEQDRMQGFMFADFRRKGEELVTAVDVDAGNPDEYEVALTAGFFVGSLIQGQNFANSANNAVNVVTVIDTDAAVEVGDGLLVTEASPPATAQIVVVGNQAGSGDLDVDDTGDIPAITSSTLDFTTLGLIIGEFIFVGGDLTAEKFVTVANNGYKRIRSIAANRLEFDKSDATMVTESGAGLTIRLFFGRVLKNETGDSGLIKRRTYQQERTLGAPDDSLPAEIQAEYIIGSVPNQADFNFTAAEKITVDFGYVGIDHETKDGPTSLKSGTRPVLDDADAFNTTSDFSRFKLAVVTPGVEAPTPLFAFMTDFTLTINNNISPDKAIGCLGAFDVTVGTFEVSAALEVYFADVASIESIRNNDDVTLDYALFKDNAGIIFDLPLIALGDGKNNVEQDQAIKLPLTADAATALKIDNGLDHTLLVVFFDFLPDLADINIC